MRSLRVRLLAYGALVAAASLAVLVGVMARATRFEVLKHSEVQGGSAAAPFAAALDSRLRAAPANPPDLTAWLAELPRPEGQSLLLVDAAGALLASVPRLVPAPIIRSLGEGGFEITVHSAGVETHEILVFRGTAGEVHDATGRVVAQLLVLPAAPSAGPAEPPPLARALLRWLLIAALAAVAAALPLGLLLARRTTRPLEALTAAARRLRLGDLTQRVEVTGADELAELARAFNGMAEGLQQAEATRKRMVADVAHELRTPLSRLRAQLEALEDGILAFDREAVGSLQADVLLLARLVADLQDLALADADRLQLLRVEVDVAGLLGRVAAAHEASARSSGVHLATACEPGLALWADPQRLGQILGNLLDNALAWTPSGGKVELRARRAGDRVELLVADSGPGIATEDLPRVFDRFYRVDPARARDGRGGAGIGLAVVRALARAHGGDVEAANVPGGGARFTVWLPALDPAALGTAPETALAGS